MCDKCEHSCGHCSCSDDAIEIALTRLTTMTEVVKAVVQLHEKEIDQKLKEFKGRESAYLNAVANFLIKNGVFEEKKDKVIDKI